jgi:uncharacterized protein
MTLTDAPDRHRFELEVDGALVGFIDYRVDDVAVVMTHAEIDPRSGGRGLGSEMVKGALDAVRASGRRVVPRCSFVAAYIDRHPEYQALLAAPDQ